jgi:very-short-patch-repair endonuclease
MYDSIYNNRARKNRRRILRKTQTPAEKRIWDLLKNKRTGFKFFRQYSVGRYILDFYCPLRRLAVEIDGGQHNEDKAKAHDAVRTEFLESQNIKVVRFWDNEVFQNIEGVIEAIIKELNPS